MLCPSHLPAAALALAAAVPARTGLLQGGEGHVGAFAEDPSFRGLDEGTDLLLPDVILPGPSC